MEKPIKQLFIDFIEDKCSQKEIQVVRQLLNSGIHDQEWRIVIDEIEARLLKNDYSQIKIDEDQLFNNIKDSAGITGKVGNGANEHHTGFNAAPQIVKRRLTAIKGDRSRDTGPFKTYGSYTWIGYAAALLAILATGIYFSRQSGPSAAAPLAQNSSVLPVKNNTHKWIKLQDGSSVQLNNGSHLDYPASFAGKANREVTLTGEAYFDIRHNSAQPFIIHTGKIRTTVLGTAFNISAYSAGKGVTVTVTRGKVMVQDEHKTLAILTPNQQFAWSNTHTGVKTAVQAENVVAWKNTDIIMDDLTLDEAAQIIKERYGMEVYFANDKVRNCRFTAAFLNSNKIQQVLQVLSDITGASLILKNNTITIDGQGC